MRELPNSSSPTILVVSGSPVMAASSTSRSEPRSEDRVGGDDIAGVDLEHVAPDQLLGVDLVHLALADHAHQLSWDATSSRAL